MYTVYTMDRVYCRYMSDTKSMGTRDARTELGRLVDEAHFRDQHVILTKNDEPRAVLVPYAWWQDHQTGESPAPGAT
jgi:prevent-host-death family protein